ncbi:MAG TPA: nitroreductase/quinone reductase family protein [Mycobacterium sp.]|nr:nitroreductase/quinone reductase family protein [Mycobacterium sp.]
MTAGGNGEAASPHHGNNAARYGVPDAAAELAKHKRLLGSARSGAILSALMLPVVLLSPPPGYGVITTTGRKTGKRRRKCIRVIRRGDRAYLVQLVPPHVAVTRPRAVSSWVWNLRADPRVRLRIKGGSFAGLAREITDPAEREVARSVLCESVYPTDYAEAGLHLRGLPTRAKIKELHRYWFDTGHPLVIELTT